MTTLLLPLFHDQNGVEDANSTVNPQIQCITRPSLSTLTQQLTEWEEESIGYSDFNVQELL